MPDVVCVADVHEGISFGYLTDAETGVSARALDLHKNFVAAAHWAIENRAKLFCVLGDLFDRTHVAPVFREMVRKDVIEPLGRAGIEVWLLAGNHDQPRAFARGTSLDDFTGYSHVKIFREPATEVREFGGTNVGFVLLPYMHRHQSLYDKIVSTGAPERIDWGEREESKGFVALDAAKPKWEFVELPTRGMAHVAVTVGMDEDPTAKILAALPDNPTDKLVRLEVTLPEALRPKVEQRRIDERLAGAFHYDVKWLGPREGVSRVEGGTMGPVRPPPR